MASSECTHEYRDTQKLLMQLCDTLPQYIYWKNSENIYLGCNKNFAKLVGLKNPLEIIGLTDAVLPWNCGLGSSTNIFTNDHALFTAEEELTFPNGEKISIFLERKYIRDSDDNSVITLFIATDISEQHVMHEKIMLAESMAERAALTAKFQTEYISNISHDLRTPLNSVLGMIEHLKNINKDPECKEDLEHLAHAGQILLGLVEDILSIVQLEAGKLPLQQESFDLRALIHGIETTIEYLAKRKGIEFIVDYPEQVASLFIGDANRLRRILTNLVGNAIKFTDQGSVTVAARILERKDSKAILSLEVRDSGSGIAPDKLNKIFERFEVSGTSYNTRKEGAGLGLTISRQFVEEMGGTIEVESQEYVGTVFRCIIPFAEQQQALSGSRFADYFQNIRIFVIDDQMERGRSLLSFLGTQASQCVTSVQFKKIIQAPMEYDFFNIVIVNDDIKGLSLKHIHDELLKAPQFKKAPWLVIGHSRDPRYIEQIKKLGFFNYLSAVDLHSIEFTQSLIQSFQHWHLSEIDRKKNVLKTMKTKVLLVEDNHLNQRVVSLMLEDLGCTVSVADKGLKAIQMINEGDYQIVLLDVGLPDIDGLTVAKKIRSQEAGHQRLPVVALTGHALNEDRIMCLEAGMDGFLTKPISATDLSRCLVEFLVEPVE